MKWEKEDFLALQLQTIGKTKTTTHDGQRRHQLHQSYEDGHHHHHHHHHQNDEKTTCPPPTFTSPAQPSTAQHSPACRVLFSKVRAKEREQGAIAIKNP
jgi:ABC-type nickel/cobalt efflux system permease component RcnA